MFAKRSLSPLAPWLLMAVLPVCVHLPALTGWLHFDPLLAVSGVTEGTWTTNGLIAGRPGWVDANAGVTTEALGALAARDWLHGIVPWWNPFSGVGMPLAAEGQTTAFFLPFGLLLALPHGLLALRILLMMLAGVFTLALLRRLGLARMPATVGAALFQVNGVFAWMAHGPMMPVAFLPLLLLGLENAAQGLRDHETIGGGYDFPWAIVFGTFWSLTAGFPETAGIDGLLAASWAMLRLVQSRHPAHYAARVFFAALIGALLASPALWAFFQALPTDFLGDHAAPIAWAFLPANWSLLLFPYLFGNIHYATAMLGQAGGIWARAGGYCDIVLVTLAVLGLRRAGPHAALRWLLLGWVLVFLARAAAIPGIGQMLDAVPLLGRSMLHVYVLPSWCMALSLLAAFGVNDWQRGAPAPIGPGLCFAALATAAALAAGWSTLGPLWQAIPSYRPYPILDLAEAGLVLVAITTLWRKPPAGWRRALLGTVIVGQAAALCAFPLLAGTRGRAIDAGSIRYLQDHAGLGRVMSFGPLVPNYGAFFGIAALGYNALPVPRNWVDYVRAHFQADANGVLLHEGDAPPPARVATLLPAYQQAGVVYVLTWPGEDPFALAASRPSLVYRGRVMDIWALPHPAPYAEAPPCRLDVTSRTHLRADCPVAATLVRRELASAGWRATIDGAARPIGLTGEIFQSLALPPGRSDIVFRYAPPYEALAWAASVLGALACFFWMFAARRPRP
jgi:hypothetical protein